MTIEVTGTGAASLGAMVSTEVATLLFEAGEHKIATKSRGARLLCEAAKVYGWDGLRNFPRPGSKHKDEKTSNVLTDFGPWGEDGKTASWYDVWFAGTPKGRQLYSEKKKLADSKATHPNEADWEADMAAMTTRIGSAVSAFKEAIKLNNMLIAVNENTEAVAMISMDGDTVKRSNKCIFIRDEKMTKFKQWSIGQFLNVDIAWCEDQKDGATYENVIKSIKQKEPETPEGFKVSTPVQWDNGLAAMAGFLTMIQENGNEKDYKSFLSHLNAAGSDYLLLSWDDFVRRSENYLELPQFKDRLVKLHEAGGLRTVKRIQSAA